MDSLANHNNYKIFKMLFSKKKILVEEIIQFQVTLIILNKMLKNKRQISKIIFKMNNNFVKQDMLVKIR